MWVVILLVAAVGAKRPEKCVTEPGPPDCGPNEHYETCPQQCPVQNCSSLWTKLPCEPKTGCYPSCRCDDGYLRDETGKCVTVYKCQGKPEPCGKNEKQVDCKIVCPPQSCESLYTSYRCAHTEPQVCEVGCDCIDGYLRNKSGTCIPSKKCPPRPPNCGPNEHYEICPQQCPVQNCSSLWTKFPCEPKTGCNPSCRCDDGYLRDETGKCVTVYKCQGKPEPCGKNEKQVDCKIVCPPQSCESLYTSYLCANTEPQVCEVGCDCIDGYLRNKSGTCIPSDKCPPRKPIKCGPNEKQVKCKQLCPPQSCAISYTTYSCDDPLPCEPGCDCVENYLRNDDGVCVLNDECPPQIYPQTCGPNEIEVQCKTICPPQSCNIACTDYACNYPIPCTPGCDCIENYLRDSNGVCILNDECTECSTVDNSSPAVEENAPSRTKPQKQSSSTSTTSSKSSSSANSKKQLSSSKSSATGRSSSSSSKKRSASSQSASSESYSSSDSKKQSSDVASSSSSQASSTSNSNNESSTSGSQPGKHSGTSEKYPQTCGPNEIEVQCKTICPPQSCNIACTDYACNYPIPCTPGCDCIENYLRDSNGVCILNDECTECSTVDNSSPAIEENAPSRTKPQKQSSSTSTTSSKSSSSANSKKQLSSSKSSANGQSSSSSSKKRSASSQSASSESYNSSDSKKQSSDVASSSSSQASSTSNSNNESSTSGSQPGKHSGTSGPPNQCGANETYAECSVGCPPYSTCPESDARLIVACSVPYPCPPGCVCKPNYRRKSYEDSTCILAEECPPVNCTRPNEVWNPCASSCFRNEFCPDSDESSSVCNDVGHNCQPKCVCEDGFFRNHYDQCVPSSECPPIVDVTSSPVSNEQCSANETHVYCDARCPDDYCPENDDRGIIACDPPYPCPPGCRCKLNYKRRSYKDDTCILAEECPPIPCTRPNEVWNTCPSGCLAESCFDVDNPPSVCNELVLNCQPKCVCMDGFYRNESDICVPASECPGKQCGENETFVKCNAGCPTDLCPVSDTRAIIACSPPYPCPQGCRCKLNYLRKSYEDYTCILAEECPPVNCTRPHEEWSSCPSPCLRENCGDVNDQPSTCNYLVQNCQPKCICSKGYFRNQSDICIPACDCPPEVHGGN